MSEVVNTNEEFLELKPVKHKKHLNRKTSEIIFVCLMLLFPIIQFIIFWIIPNISSILLAFKLEDTDIYSMVQFETFFQKLFHGKTFSGAKDELVYAIINSLIYFAVNIFICTPIVIFFSYILFRKVPFSGAFRVIFYLPSIIGVTVTTALFKSVCNGPILELLHNWGIFDSDVMQLGLFEAAEGHENLPFLMVILYSVWTCVGINMILFNGAMRRIPNEIFESANIDGVGFFRQFFDIVIPLIWPTIATLIVFSLSGIFVSYTTSMLLTPGVNEAKTIGYYIFSRVAEDNLSYPAAVGLVFTAVGLPFVLLVKWGLNKIGSNVEY